MLCKELQDKVFCRKKFFIFIFLFLPPIVMADTLSDVMLHTIRTHPSILGAEANYQATHQTINEAKSEFYPTLDITAARGRQFSDTPSLTGQGIFGTTLPRQENGFVIGQQLFSGFNTVNTIKQKRSQTMAANEQLKEKVNDIALQVTKVYLDVLRSQAILEVAEEHVAAQRDIVAKINKRVMGGVGKSIDSQLAKSRLALAQSDLINVRNQAAINRVKYKELTRLDPNQLITPAINQSYVPHSLEEALSMAQKGAPRLNKARANLSASRHNFNVTQSPFYPKLTLDISGNYNEHTDGTRGDYTDERIMLTLKYNLLNGGADLAKYRKAGDELSQSQDTVDDELLQVRQSVGIAWATYIADQYRYKELYDNVTATKGALDGYWKEFDIGQQRDFFIVLSAENDYYNARSRLIDFQYDHLYNTYSLLSTLGNLAWYVLPRLKGA